MMILIKKVFLNPNILRALPFFVLVLGLVLFITSLVITSESKEIFLPTFLGGIGKSMLAGGFFTLLLKTIQFMGVFKDELTDIIFEPKTLKNRKDLAEFWEKTSTVLIKNKFPRISTKLIRDVKINYLPTNETSYYENTEHFIEISIKDKLKRLVLVKIDTSLDLISESKKTDCTYQFGSGSVVGENLNVKSFKINQVEKLTDCDSWEKEISGVKHRMHKITLTGSHKYSISKVEEHTFNLNEDDIINFMATKIHSKFDIKIQVDKEINIDFYKSGTLESFDTKRKTPIFEHYAYNGLIYPQQGYFIQIKIKPVTSKEYIEVTEGELSYLGN